MVFAVYRRHNSLCCLPLPGSYFVDCFLPGAVAKVLVNSDAALTSIGHFVDFPVMLSCLTIGLGHYRTGHST